MSGRGVTLDGVIVTGLHRVGAAAIFADTVRVGSIVACAEGWRIEATPEIECWLVSTGLPEPFGQVLLSKRAAGLRVERLLSAPLLDQKPRNRVPFEAFAVHIQRLAGVEGS